MLSDFRQRSARPFRLGCDADRFESQSPLDSPEGSHALPVNLAQDPVEIRILGNVSGRSVTRRLGYPDEQGLKILKERDAFDAEDGEAIPFVLVPIFEVLVDTAPKVSGEANVVRPISVV